MKTIEQAFDNARWADVPLEYPAGPYANQAEWARAIADEYSAFAADPEAAHSEIERFGSILPVLAAPGLFKVLWYQGDYRRVPLLAHVYVVPDEQSGGLPLAELAGAHAEGLARPPVVDTLPSDPFGSVARVLSLSPDEQRNRLNMRMCLTGRQGGVVVMIDARTHELDFGALALDDFTALIDGVRVSDQPDAA